MSQLPERRILLRWGFLGMGYLFLFGHNFAVRSLLLADMWGQVLFGPDSALHAFTMAAAYFFVLPASLLCLATGWGLKRHMRWARWSGAAVCAMSLPWFPIMTFLGVLGLYGLATLNQRGTASGPAPAVAIASAARRSKDYWTAKSQSKLQPVIGAVFMIAGFNLIGLLTWWARKAGIRGAGPRGLEFWGWFSVFILLQVAVHEAGHALMAWALYYRVRVVSMGPLTLWHDRYGFHFHFNWSMLFHTGGYTGSVATSQQNLRLKHIAVVGAGPAASLLNGAVFLAIFFSLPGTAWQSYWWIAAYNAMLGILLGVLNLIPVGYSDGSMLFHLILDTPAGRVLLFHQQTELMQEEASACHDRADFQKEVELKRRMVERAKEAGEGNAMAIAVCHQTLGHALLSAEDWPAAEAEFRRCLAFEAECAVNSALAANAWSGLVWACTKRQHVVEGGRAYAAAVGAIRPRKNAADAVNRAVSCVMLAQVHVRAAGYEAAIEEAEEGLRILPPRRERLMLRANLQAALAEAQLYFGLVEDGIASAEAAANVLRSAEMPEPQRNLAWDELGELGEALWRAGLAEEAIGRMREAIERLEAGGAATTAAGYRIKLCAILRQTGRAAEGANLLPEGRDLPLHMRRWLAAERVELSLVEGRAVEAIAAGLELTELWRAETSECAVERAAAESLLARAYLEAGDRANAVRLSQNALEVLGPMQHPEAAVCRLTAALAGSLRPEEVAAALEEGRRQVEGAALLTRAERERLGGTLARSAGAIAAAVGAAAV
ncbi:MAG TPA: M50 family metallopeptidase [Candidatus Acidoferrales bacterium]|nr:M50 family metallopeptidase [Candidatus Acidoferrales bacterium]